MERVVSSAQQDNLTGGEQDVNAHNDEGIV
jgi:hypothetical protein